MKSWDHVKDWDDEESDYIQLMTNFLLDRITVKQYCMQFLEMNVKRQMFSDQEDVVIQKHMATPTITTKSCPCLTRSMNQRFANAWQSL